MRAAYYGLHYGKEWLECSMKSVRDFVDEIYVFYVSRPSHGTQTSIPCPETREELKSIADDFQSVWWDCPHFNWEGEHRDYAVSTLKDKGVDTILVVDGDEIWEGHHLDFALKSAEETNHAVNRVFMHHFWRSLKWVCDDPAAPVRVLRVNGTPDEAYIGEGKVFHMGYAQTPEIVFYKQQIHGHIGEWRQRWFEEKFLPWRPGMGDVHPTNIDFWTPEQTDYPTYQVLSHLCGDHPYFDLDLIMPTGSLAK